MATFAPLSRKIRHVQRWAHLLEVLAKHGFADLAERMGLHTMTDRGREILGKSPRHQHESLTIQERIRILMEELGPTYVKLGQVLSTRPDLIPQEWANEFKKLQDDVPGVPYEDIEKIIQEEFPNRARHLFVSIEKESLAAASIAQVHRATLCDGTQILLKVLRPGIREITQTDMEILRDLAEKAESHFTDLGYSPVQVVDEFAKEIARELDLTHEARSTERFRTQFADDPDIVFPKVYWEATTRSVLAVEEMRGIVLSRLSHGELCHEDRHRVVENGTRAIVRQCLEFGFFHADPHPGNLVALSGGRIAFIDCGMTGQLDAKTTRDLANLVSGIVSGDTEHVISAIAALADIPPDILDDRGLQSDLGSIASQFQGTPLGKLNLGQILQDFFATLRNHRVRCPADMVFLIKALTTIESVGRWLDPEFRITEYAQPYVERLVKERYSLPAIASRIRNSFVEYGEFLESLPGQIGPLLSQLRRNRIAVNLEHRGLTRLTRTIEHASRNISFALIITGVLLASAILILAARAPGFGIMYSFGIGGLIFALVLMLFMVISNHRARDE